MKFIGITLFSLVTANIAFAENRAFRAEGTSKCFIGLDSKDPYCKKIVDKARAEAQINAEESCSPKYPIQITDWKEELPDDLLGPDFVRGIKSSAVFECTDI